MALPADAAAWLLCLGFFDGWGWAISEVWNVSLTPAPLLSDCAISSDTPMDLSFRSSMRLARLGALEEKLLPKEPLRRLLLLDLRVLRIVCIFDKIGQKVLGGAAGKI